MNLIAIIGFGWAGIELISRGNERDLLLGIGCLGLAFAAALVTAGFHKQ